MPDPKITLTITANPVTTGIDKFFSFFESRLKKVQDFNQKIENGAAAVNQLLAQAGAVLGARALNEYGREALAARQAQTQLDAALRQAGQFTPEYRAQLTGLAQALEKISGIDNDQILQVIRKLVADVPPDQIARVTANILDLSAAMGIDLQNAANLVARGLIDGTVSLGRFQLQIDKTLSKADQIKQLSDQLESRFSGQASAQVQALGPELAEAAALQREAKKAAGELVLEFKAAFLKEFVVGLRDMVTWLRSFKQEHPGVMSFLKEFFAGLGRIVSTPFAGYVMAAVIALLAFKIAATGVLLVINPLRAAFAFFAGSSFLTVLKNFDACIQLLGFWRGAALAASQAGGVLAGVMTILGTEAAIVAVAFAGWHLGKFIGELEAGGMKIREWVEIMWLVIFDGWERIKQITRDTWTRIKFFILETLAQITLGIARGLASLPNWLLKALGTSKAEVEVIITERRRVVLKIKRDRAQALADSAAEYAAAADVSSQAQLGVVADARERQTQPNALRPGQFADEYISSQQRVLEAQKFSQQRLKSLLDLEEAQLDVSYKKRAVTLDEYLAKKSAMLEREIQPEETFVSEHRATAARQRLRHRKNNKSRKT